MKSPLSTAVLALAVALVLTGPAGAIAPGLGEFKARSNGAAVPAGSEIAVIPDDTDAVTGSDPAYAAARKAAAEALTRLGMRVADGAKLRLKIELTTPRFGMRPAEDERDNSSVVSTDSTAAPGPSRKTRVTNHVEVPFEADASHAQPGMSLALFLIDERGAPLWTATFQAGGRVADTDSLVRRMTTAAIASLGAHAERSYVLACEVDAEKTTPAGICLP